MFSPAHNLYCFVKSRNRLGFGILFFLGSCLNPSTSLAQEASEQKTADLLNKSASASVSEKRSNALAKEKSPYLLQHATNPVNWYPWGDEAFVKARDENKLIFLSIGYSTCHWCHVMEEESFENEKIAEVLNRYFISIKVDREERPDVDQVYMTFVQASTGSGGWPLNVWLTPDLKPFVGGTYFPPESRGGRVGLIEAAQQIQSIWESDPDSVSSQSSRIADFLREMQSATSSDQADSQEKPGSFLNLAKALSDQLQKELDEVNGGFGSAPKFPNPAVLRFLLSLDSRLPRSVGDTDSDDFDPQATVWFVLESMARGGIYDQLEGGFHRYTVDGAWKVPHFEKMLYDQAQLVELYLTAYQETGSEIFQRIAVETLEYLEERMLSESGAFYSAEDADSYASAGDKKKQEGAFYVWSLEDFQTVLKDFPEAFRTELAADLGLKPDGNAPEGTDPHGEFEGKNILYWDQSNRSESEVPNTIWNSPERETARRALIQARNQRPRPFRDEKIITSWNGLMLSALARAGEVLQEPKWSLMGESCARFLKANLWDAREKKLFRRYLDGSGDLKGVCDDYADLIRGLVDLYESTANVEWLQWAVELQEAQIDRFEDKVSGGFFNAESGDPSLITRFKPEFDGAEPSANSVTTINLFWLGWALDKQDWRDKASKTLTTFQSSLEENPRGSPMLIQSSAWMKGSPAQIILSGNPDNPQFQKFRRTLSNRPDFRSILLYANRGPGEAFLKSHWTTPIWESDPGSNNGNDDPKVFWCENFVCETPVQSMDEILRLLYKHKN